LGIVIGFQVGGRIMERDHGKRHFSDRRDVRFPVSGVRGSVGKGCLPLTKCTSRADL
jgi:hypothetical protein